VPESEQPATAVIVSGGKQYRVAEGDRILVDRLAAEPGSEVTIERVLLHADGNDVKVGAPAIDGLTVTAKVIGHPRGPKIVAFRYKPKKRVRVHRGARADLTAIEIVSIGAKRAKKASEERAGEQKPARRRRAASRVDKTETETK
jgi:large subunit ribosomal protein L21